MEPPEQAFAWAGCGMERARSDAMGLPLCKLGQMLKELGVDLL